MTRLRAVVVSLRIALLALAGLAKALILMLGALVPWALAGAAGGSH